MQAVFSIEFAGGVFPRAEALETELRRSTQRPVSVMASPSCFTLAEVTFNNGHVVTVGLLGEASVWVEDNAGRRPFEWAVVRALLALGGTTESKIPPAAPLACPLGRSAGRVLVDAGNHDDLGLGKDPSTAIPTPNS